MKRKFLGSLSFLYKIYVALCFVATLLLFYLPLRMVLSKESSKSKAHILFYFWAKTLQYLMFIFLRVKHSKVTSEENLIVCANHTSYLDIVLLTALMRKKPFLFVGKSEVLEYPFIRSFFRNYHIPVNRENRVQAARSFLKIDRAIKEGWSIAIFPEGGIPDKFRPRMIEFKSGAFKLAMENKKCILPISFLSNYQLISDPSDVFGPAHPGFANTVVHPLVCYDEYKDWTEENLKQKIFDTINQPLLELL